MTAMNEFYSGRRVYTTDDKSECFDINKRLLVVEVLKSGKVKCAADDGSTHIFLKTELEVYPDE